MRGELFALARVVSPIVKSLVDCCLTLLGVTIYRLGLASLTISMRRHSPRVLMYHAVEPQESDYVRGLDIHTEPRRFSEHLEFLARHYHVIPLAELESGCPGDRAAVITFDDGFRSVYVHAWPMLRDRGLPATCYLVSDVIEGLSSRPSRLIWLNELNWFIQRHGAKARAIVARRLGLKPARVGPRLTWPQISRFEPESITATLDELRKACGSAGEEVSEGRLYLNAAEIEEMASGGVRFGNHTASHAILANLSAEECRAELQRAANDLARLAGADRTLAYPFGSHSEETRRIALDLGFTTIMEVEGTNRPLDLTRIGRVNVTSCSVALLFARVEVVGPVKWAFKRWFRGLSAGRQGPHRGSA
jgi:peptidoglycan/xylan/chitin deacetylase (PgdA/CDA1 family)